jgi:mRNA interferase MazF
VVVASLTGDDVLVCQITSRTVNDSYGVAVLSGDFATGKLHHDSNIRPNRLFTADSAIVLYRAGKLTANKMAEVTAKIVEIITA